MREFLRCLVGSCAHAPMHSYNSDSLNNERPIGLEKVHAEIALQESRGASPNCLINRSRFRCLGSQYLILSACSYRCNIHGGITEISTILFAAIKLLVVNRANMSS